MSWREKQENWTINTCFMHVSNQELGALFSCILSLVDRAQTCLHYWHWWIEDQAIFSLVLVSDSWPQKWINLVSSCPTEFWESSSYSRQLDHLSLKPENWVSYTSSRCVCVCILVFSTSLCSCLWYILLLVLKDKGEGISGHISLTHLGSNCFILG